MSLSEIALASGNLYVAVFLVGYIGAITPGPDILLIIRNTIAFGIRAALLALSGIASGWLIYLGCVYFGLAQVMSYPLAQFLLSVIGGGYLIYIGYKIVCSSSHRDLASIMQEGASTHKRAGFLQALFVNLSNPKAILFFVVVVAPLADRGFELGLVVLFCSLVCGFLSVIMVGLYVRRWLNSRVFLWIDRLSAGLFCLFGCLLLYRGAEIFSQLTGS